MARASPRASTWPFTRWSCAPSWTARAPRSSWSGPESTSTGASNAAARRRARPSRASPGRPRSSTTQSTACSASHASASGTPTAWATTKRPLPACASSVRATCDGPSGSTTSTRIRRFDASFVLMVDGRRMPVEIIAPEFGSSSIAGRMYDSALSCPRMSPEVEQAVGLAREFLHRSGALRVGLLVDRGDDREPAVVECARLAPITVTEDGEREELAHGAQLATPVPPLPEVRQIPGIQADAIAGTVAAPPGGIEMLGRALRDIAALLGGRSIAAADFETIDPETPLGLAARGGEPLVALVGDEQFE